VPGSCLIKGGVDLRLGEPERVAQGLDDRRARIGGRRRIAAQVVERRLELGGAYAQPPGQRGEVLPRIVAARGRGRRDRGAS